MRLPLPTTRDPLLPLERIVGFLLTIIIGFGLLGIALISFASGSVSYFGDDRACVVVPSDTLPTGSPITAHSETGQRIGLRPEIYAQPESLEICNDNPTTRDTITASTAQLIDVIFWCGAVIGLYLVLRTANRRGLFSINTAQWTLLLGWYLAIGSVITELIRQVAIGTTLSGVTQDTAWYTTLTNLDFPWIAVVAGMGLMTLARVLARAVLLQREQDHTI